jgi:serine/threonine protein kinase
VRAARANTTIVADPSQDVWALGVMAFEAVMRDMALRTKSQCLDCALERSPYSWEQPAEEQPPEWQQSRLHGLIEPYLSRDPRARPSASVIAASMGQLGYKAAGSHADAT